MSDTLINLQRRKQSAGDMASVVRTMKAMATSNITQYENSVHSLQDYYRTISLGIHACFGKEKITVVADNHNNKNAISVAVIFGSDQGLGGQFSDTISCHAEKTITEIPGATEIWVVGEGVYNLLVDGDFSPTKHF